MFVDSHCHLSFPEFKGRMPDMLAAMAAAQVDEALCICTTIEEFDTVRGLADAYPQLWCTVGVHPDSEGVIEPSVADLLRLAGHPRVLGIGETGLDYYRLGERTVADMAWQRERFAVHIHAALQADLPLVVHTRSASADTLDILRTEGRGRARGVFHCFTETREVARAALDLGFSISFSGILSFRNAADLRDVARDVPLDRCLIETDSPYLAPAPHRGKLNQPAFVPLVAAQLAAVKGLSVEEIGRHTTANYHRLFGRSAVPGGSGDGSS